MKKYGPESCACVKEWSNDFGFPANGSFSSNQLKKLEENLKKAEEEMLKKKKVKGKQVKRMQQHFKCLKMWQSEAESRDQRERQGKVEKTEERAKPQTRDTQAPAHPQTHIRPPAYNPLYPSLTSWDDPTLQEGPPRRPPPQPVPPNDQEPANGAEGPHPEATVAFSPVAGRTRGAAMNPGGPVLTLPMVQAAGVDGVQLVFRPWGYKDMVDYTKHLPKPQEGGSLFVVPFRAFCREFAPTFPEIKRILLLLMGPVDFEKVKDHLAGQLALRHPEWDDALNGPYREALNRLCAHIIQMFPIAFDLSKVTSCTQSPGESVDAYLHRLVEVFTTHGGMPRPDNTDNMTPWEQQLASHFLQGLLPSISTATKLSCVGWKKARLDAITDHARHAMECQSAEEEKRGATEKKAAAAAQKAAAAAQLTMMQAVAQATRASRGRSRGPTPPDRPGHNNCFICGSPDHWAHDCPERKPNYRRGRGRGRGRGGRDGGQRADFNQWRCQQAD